MKAFNLLLTLLIGCSGSARDYKVGLIDTGADRKEVHHLCARGHYDFNMEKAGLAVHDELGHGTEMAKTIEAFPDGENYCIVVMTVFPSANRDLNVIARAINYLVEQHVDIINMSMEGGAYLNAEKNALVRASNQGITIFVAAGNEGQNLNEVCNVWPACYRGIPRMMVVGGTAHMERARSSNYGAIVRIWEDFYSNEVMGTSLSTAIASGKFLNYLMTHEDK